VETSCGTETVSVSIFNFKVGRDVPCDITVKVDST
jgi:hypothetical protein